MADCSKNFKDDKEEQNSFLSNISITTSEIKQLVKSRNELRKKIRIHLKDKKVKSTKFYRQGSYAHGTLIKPLDEDYDIDDGVYLDLTSFEDELTTKTIHNWIVEAVKNHTQLDPVDKEACVRSLFKAGYHIDLPAYKIEVVNKNDEDEEDEEIYYIAKKTAGWEESDPRAMTDWFLNQIKIKSEQLRRLVKYIKAWRDYRGTKNSTKLPSGLTLTILVCEQYESDTRDDISFYETVKKIETRLKEDEDIWKPYEPTENMRDYISDAQFKNFLGELKTLIENGKSSIIEDSCEEAAKIWQKSLGDRFPIYKDSEDDNGQKPKKFPEKAIVGTTVKSANNCQI